MLKRFRLFAVAIAVLAILTATAWLTTSKSFAQANRDAANGNGTVLVQDEQNTTFRRHFSFNARRNPDGTVTGGGILQNPAFTGVDGKTYTASFDISCLRIEGNVAVMGGTIKRTNEPNLVDTVFFAVQDVGEPGKNRDYISLLVFNDEDPTTNTGDPQSCQDLLIEDFGMLLIDAGNIQVRGSSSQ
jgi:hypothetical protein